MKNIWLRELHQEVYTSSISNMESMSSPHQQGEIFTYQNDSLTKLS